MPKADGPAAPDCGSGSRPTSEAAAAPPVPRRGGVQVSTPGPHAARRPGRRGLSSVAALLLVLLALVTLALHQGLAPERGPWPEGLAPSGFLRRWLLLGPLAGVVSSPAAQTALVLLPSLALAAAVFAATRSLAARFASATLLLAGFGFAWYGLTPRLADVWGFFGWRWSAIVAATAALLVLFACAPAMVARARRLAPWLFLALYLPLFLLVCLLVRDPTGTDPALPFAVSPWPVIPVFGIELLGGFLLGLLAVAAAALAAAAPVHPTLRATAAVLAAGPVLAFATRRLDPGLPLLAAAAGVGAGVLLVLWPAAPAPRVRAARVTAGAVLLAVLPILAGEALLRLDYHRAREVAARRIIEALEAYYEREGEYPEELRVLLATGDLEEIPRPPVGFLRGPEDRFTYQSFGTSYLLEFSAPGWVQCTYNPPWEDEGTESGAPVESLEEAWSCPAQPPALW